MSESQHFCGEVCADVLAVDTAQSKVVVVKRLSCPEGLALPGGRLDVGEMLEQCAVREFKEETGLEIQLVKVLTVLSRPERDPRGHKVSVVFLAQVVAGEVRNEPGKTEVLLLSVDEINQRLEDFVFDHDEVLIKYLKDYQL